MTGREREQLVALLASGSDFRFEAGRAIRFERRGGSLEVGARHSLPGRRMYHPGNRGPTWVNRETKKLGPTSIDDVDNWHP